MMFPITVTSSTSSSSNRYEKSMTPPTLLLERDIIIDGGGRRLPSPYLDPIRVYTSESDSGKISPIEIDSRRSDRSPPKEDYFYSLYQNAKKTIHTSSPPATVNASKDHHPSPTILFTPSSPTSSVTGMDVKAHSPNYPVTPPSRSAQSSPIYRKPSPSILHLPTSPTISDITSQSHLYNHHHPPPTPPAFYSTRRECSTGSCKWLFPLDRCHSCRKNDFPYHIPSHIPLHQRAFFSNEFLLRQKEKWRRPRTVYTEKQLAALEKAYKKNKYLRGQERKELCKTLNLEERHIKVWYQNRRAKERGQIRHDKWLQRTRKQHVNHKIKIAINKTINKTINLNIGQQRN